MEHPPGDHEFSDADDRDVEFVEPDEPAPPVEDDAPALTEPDPEAEEAEES